MPVQQTCAVAGLKNHNNKQEEKKCYQEIVTDAPK
jgi:hypothetical protein